MAKILIVDDSEDLLEMFELLLSSKGHTIQTSTNTKDALQKVSDFSPNIILLDIKLGEDSGRDLCVEIKKTYKTIHIILMSASPDLLFDYLLCSADDILVKPFDINTLINKIHKVRIRS